VTSRAESAVVNVAGLVQGVVLVTFPAASAIFTDKSGGSRAAATWASAGDAPPRVTPNG
jgi:hypothetical protein